MCEISGRGSERETREGQGKRDGVTSYVTETETERLERIFKVLVF